MEILVDVREGAKYHEIPGISLENLAQDAIFQALPPPIPPKNDGRIRCSDL